MSELPWFEKILKWCDIWDLDAKKKVEIWYELLDQIVNRVPEARAFWVLLTIAYKANVTDAQMEAMMLEAEAIELGILPSRYIAQKRGTSLRAAQSLLKRANERNIDVSDEYSSVIDVLDNKFPWHSEPTAYVPTEQEIGKELAAMTSECAGSGVRCEGKAPAQYALCWHCLQEFGAPGARDERTQRWLEPEILRIKANSKREARNRLYAKHRGMVDSAEEYDALTAAA